jgi:glycosyltransferase involved in cell wall biosynthesis
MEHPKNADSQWSRYFVKNVEYNKKHNWREQFKIFRNTLYSREAKSKLLQLIDDFKPDIAHLHNFNHQLSPSILSALNMRNIPTVMTLHDFKLVCPSYSMLNHGKVCELCRGKRFYHCATTRCHKDSFSKSFLATLESYLHHQILDSYKNIRCFICPSKFIMNKIQEMGLRGKFIYLLNFVDINRFETAETSKDNKFVYWGRLSSEKGIFTLIEAADGLAVKLEIIGEGPLRKNIEAELGKRKINNVVLSGYLSGENLFSRIKDSLAAIVPSQCYENNPFSILEAFALGKPVIGSRIGGIPELIKDNITGLSFEAGNSKDLKEKILSLLSNPENTSEMGRNAREFAEQELNSEKHYQILMEVYTQALKSHENPH